VLAAFGASAYSPRRPTKTLGRFLHQFLWSPNPVSRKQRRRVVETGSTESLLNGEAKYLALARPFSRKIEQPGDPHSQWRWPASPSSACSRLPR
jgi:hypothetical protein